LRYLFTFPLPQSHSLTHSHTHREKERKGEGEGEKGRERALPHFLSILSLRCNWFRAACPSTTLSQRFASQTRVGRHSCRLGQMDIQQAFIGRMLWGAARSSPSRTRLGIPSPLSMEVFVSSSQTSTGGRARNSSARSGLNRYQSKVSGRSSDATLAGGGLTGRGGLLTRRVFGTSLHTLRIDTASSSATVHGLLS